MKSLSEKRTSAENTRHLGASAVLIRTANTAINRQPFMSIAEAPQFSEHQQQLQTSAGLWDGIHQTLAGCIADIDNYATTTMKNQYPEIIDLAKQLDDPKKRSTALSSLKSLLPLILAPTKTAHTTAQHLYGQAMAYQPKVAGVAEKLAADENTVSEKVDGTGGELAKLKEKSLKLQGEIHSAEVNVGLGVVGLVGSGAYLSFIWYTEVAIAELTGGAAALFAAALAGFGGSLYDIAAESQKVVDLTKQHAQVLTQINTLSAEVAATHVAKSQASKLSSHAKSFVTSSRNTLDFWETSIKTLEQVLSKLDDDSVNSSDILPALSSYSDDWAAIAKISGALLQNVVSSPLVEKPIDIREQQQSSSDNTPLVADSTKVASKPSLLKSASALMQNEILIEGYCQSFQFQQPLNLSLVSDLPSTQAVARTHAMNYLNNAAPVVTAANAACGNFCTDFLNYSETMLASAQTILNYFQGLDGQKTAAATGQATTGQQAKSALFSVSLGATLLLGDLSANQLPAAKKVLAVFSSADKDQKTIEEQFADDSKNFATASSKAKEEYQSKNGAIPALVADIASQQSTISADKTEIALAAVAFVPGTLAVVVGFLAPEVAGIAAVVAVGFYAVGTGELAAAIKQETAAEKKLASDRATIKADKAELVTLSHLETYAASLGTNAQNTSTAVSNLVASWNVIQTDLQQLQTDGTQMVTLSKLIARSLVGPLSSDDIQNGLASSQFLVDTLTSYRTELEKLNKLANGVSTSGKTIPVKGSLDKPLADNLEAAAQNKTGSVHSQAASYGSLFAGSGGGAAGAIAGAAAAAGSTIAAPETDRIPSTPSQYS